MFQHLCLGSFTDYIHRISVSVSCPDLFKLGFKFIRQSALPIEGNYKIDILDKLPECLFLDLKGTKIKKPMYKNHIENKSNWFPSTHQPATKWQFCAGFSSGCWWIQRVSSLILRILFVLCLHIICWEMHKVILSESESFVLPNVTDLTLNICFRSWSNIMYIAISPMGYNCYSLYGVEILQFEHYITTFNCFKSL